MKENQPKIKLAFSFSSPLLAQLCRISRHLTSGPASIVIFDQSKTSISQLTNWKAVRRPVRFELILMSGQNGYGLQLHNCTSEPEFGDRDASVLLLGILAIAIITYKFK